LGFSVQLKHLNDDNSQSIVLKNADGKVIAEMKGFQKNPYYSTKEERTATLMTQVPPVSSF